MCGKFYYDFILSVKISILIILFTLIAAFTKNKKEIT